MHALVWQQQYERSNAGCHAAVLLFGVGFQSSVDLVCGSLIVGAADKHFLPLHLSTARVVVAGCSCRTLRLQVPLLSHPSYAFAGVICCCCWRWLCSTGPQLCVHWQCVSRHNTKRQDRLPLHPAMVLLLSAVMTANSMSVCSHYAAAGMAAGTAPGMDGLDQSICSVLWGCRLMLQYCGTSELCATV